MRSDDERAGAFGADLGADGPRNLLLQVMPPEPRAWIGARLVAEDCALGSLITRPVTVPTRVWFPDDAIASFVNHVDGGPVEVGTVGREGLVGIEVFLDTPSSPNEVLWQSPGRAWSLPAEDLREAIARWPAVDRLLRRYLFAFWVQVAQTAACNRAHALEQRCARWLLMTQDRAGTGRSFTLTQQFLAYMLGVRRAGVSEAAGALRRRGVIEYSRGAIELVSCACYRIVQDNFARALEVPPPEEG